MIAPPKPTELPVSVSVEVVRGKPGFANACRAAAISMAMIAACSNVAADPFSRSDPVQTPAIKQLKTLMSDQAKPAEPLSSEQAQTLRYGMLPPVKTRVLMDGKTQTQWTLHPFDLVRLAREAVKEAAKIEGISVNPNLVGAIMLAESSLVARTGWSSNGKTPSMGLGQLEPNTAKALGVQNANDPRQNAVAVARLLAESQRFANKNSSVDKSIAISLAYNTSTALRNDLVNRFGSSLSMDDLPKPTQHHVKNMAYGSDLMARFAKLSDQHDKTAEVLAQKSNLASTQSATDKLLAPGASYLPVHAQSAVNSSPGSSGSGFSASAAAADAVTAALSNPLDHNARQLKENTMQTASIPAPSLKALFAGLSTDNANRIRLEQNQKHLEKAGHILAVPMTSKGLDTMRQAISEYVRNMEGSKDGVSSRQAQASMALSIAANFSVVAKVASEAKNFAMPLIEKLRDQVLQALKAPQEQRSPVPNNLTTASLMESTKANGLSIIGGAKENMQQLREQSRMNQQNNEQQRPA